MMERGTGEKKISCGEDTREQQGQLLMFELGVTGAVWIYLVAGSQTSGLCRT